MKSFRILLPADIECIQDFERTELAKKTQDEVEAELQSWSAPWRQEALEHYLPLGWSFGIFANQTELHGYFLAQPLLFFQGDTQALWIEHMSAKSPEDLEALEDLAIRWARDKHLQSVHYRGQKIYKR